MFKQILKASLDPRGVGSVPAEEDGLKAGAVDKLDGTEACLRFEQILKAILLLFFQSQGVGSVPAEEDGLEAGAVDSHDGIEGGHIVQTDSKSHPPRPLPKPWRRLCSGRRGRTRGRCDGLA